MRWRRLMKWKRLAGRSISAGRLIALCRADSRRRFFVMQTREAFRSGKLSNRAGLRVASCAPGAAAGRAPAQRRRPRCPSPPLTPTAPSPSPKPGLEQPRYGWILETVIRSGTADLDGLAGAARVTQFRVCCEPSYNGSSNSTPTITARLSKIDGGSGNKRRRRCPFYLRKE